MSERWKQAAVVVAGLALFGPLVVHRSLRVLENERFLLQGENLVCDPQGFRALRHAPAGLVPSSVHRYVELPGLPALPLGQFRVTGPVALLQRLADDPLLQFQCVQAQLEQHGANAWRADTVRRVGWDTGELTGTAYLLYASPEHLPQQAARQPALCVVAAVAPGSSAARGGFAVGDLLWAWSAQDHAAGGRPCDALMEAMEEPASPELELVTLRAGRERVAALPFQALRQGRTGMTVRNLPVLAAGLSLRPTPP